MLAEHTNQYPDWSYCCPHCFKSEVYEFCGSGDGADEREDRVNCKHCGKPFMVWAEQVIEYCSGFCEDD